MKLNITEEAYLTYLCLSTLVIIGLVIWLVNTPTPDCKPLAVSEQLESAPKVKAPSQEEILVKYISSKYRTTPKEAGNIVKLVHSYSGEENFPPPHLVFAVIAVESSFRPNVVSHAGARGLMQVMPINEPGITIEDNIVAGIWVLQRYRARVATDEAALAAYNVGITAYKRGKRNHKYVDKVVQERKKFQILMNSF